MKKHLINEYQLSFPWDKLNNFQHCVPCANFNKGWCNLCIYGPGCFTPDFDAWFLLISDLKMSTPVSNI
jgi:hypothetical protein